MFGCQTLFLYITIFYAILSIKYEHFIKYLYIFYKNEGLMKEHDIKDLAAYLENINNSPARDLMYELVPTYAKYMDIHHYFLTEENLTSTDAHTLKHICQNPGVTISEITEYWGKTKGTVSAQISRLEEKNLVRKEKDSINAKKTHIYPTETGIRTNESHMKFDIEEIIRLYDFWGQKYTAADIEKFWEMLAYYKDFLEERVKQQ